MRYACRTLLSWMIGSFSAEAWSGCYCVCVPAYLQSLQARASMSMMARCVQCRLDTCFVVILRLQETVVAVPEAMHRQLVCWIGMNSRVSRSCDGVSAELGLSVHPGNMQLWPVGGRISLQGACSHCAECSTTSRAFCTEGAQQ